MSTIPYGRQDIDSKLAVLRSDILTKGPAVPAFETGVAEL
jgi:hypothetical protein